MSGAGSYNIYKSELSHNGPMSKAAALTISPNVLVTLPVNTPIKSPSKAALSSAGHS